MPIVLAYIFVPFFLKQLGKFSPHTSNPVSGRKHSLSIISDKDRIVCVITHNNPYFTLMRSSFSSIGSAAIHRKNTVPAAWTQSMGKPVM